MQMFRLKLKNNPDVIRMHSILVSSGSNAKVILDFNKDKPSFFNVVEIYSVHASGSAKPSHEWKFGFVSSGLRINSVSFKELKSLHIVQYGLCNN